MTLDELSVMVEKISVSYAAKNTFERTSDWFLLKLQEELGELSQAHLKASLRARTKNLSGHELEEARADECADLLCHVLLYAIHHRIDLRAAVDRKWLSWLER